MLAASLGLVQVLLLLGWTQVGRRRLGGTLLAPLEARMRLAAGATLALCLPFGPLVALGVLPPLAGALAGAAAFLLHAALEPRRASFWHHRRVRPVGALLAGGAAALAGYFLPYPELAPSIWAVAIFQTYLSGRVAVAAEREAELVGLRDRIVRLEAERHNQAVQHESPTFTAKSA